VNLAALLRLAVFLTGGFLLLMSVVALADPHRLAGQLGLAATNAVGAASLRADLFGFFATAGGLAVAAAARRAAYLLTAPLLLIGLALTGRIVALAIGPFDGSLLPPMAVEAVMLAVLAAGRVRGA